MVDIYGFLKKIPGGMLLIPALITAVINTLFPEAISASGSMTSALFKTGSMTFASYLIFVSGATTDLRNIRIMFKRSGSLLLVRLALGIGCGYLFYHLFGLTGVLGINTIAFVTTICSSSPAVFMGIIQDYGEREDMCNFAVCALLVIPAFPLMILDLAGGGSFDVMEVISVLIPFALGLALGNLDPALGRLFSQATPLTLPFLGFCFGASINLISAAKAGLSGLLLAGIVLAIQVPVSLLTDRVFNRRPGYCGVAMCATGGSSLIVPSLLISRAAFASYLDAAMAQIALCLLVTNLALPFIVKWIAGRWGAPRTLAQPKA